MGRTLLFLMIVALAVEALAPTVHAGMRLYLDDGLGHSVTVPDGDPLDAHPSVGVITFIGSLGVASVWQVNVTTGISKPVIGGPTSAEIDLNSLSVSSTGGGTLTIGLTDTDFALPPGGGALGIANWRDHERYCTDGSDTGSGQLGVRGD